MIWYRIPHNPSWQRHYCEQKVCVGVCGGGVIFFINDQRFSTLTHYCERARLNPRHQASCHQFSPMLSAIGIHIQRTRQRHVLLSPSLRTSILPDYPPPSPLLISLCHASTEKIRLWTCCMPVLRRPTTALPCPHSASQIPTSSCYLHHTSLLFHSNNSHWEE